MKKIEKYKIAISPKTYKQMSLHVNFLKKVSKNAASELRKNFIKNIQSLQEMPQRCNFFNEEIVPAKKYRKMVCAKRYLILFQIIEDTVFIETIIDTRQNLKWLSL